jgi:carboxyl-terminal processing protease
MLRNGEELEFKAERRQLQVVVAEGTLMEDGIGLVAIYNFDDRCAEESIAAIETLRAQGAEKLILDVRYNVGGYAHEMVALLDYLLPEGDLFRTVDYRGKESVDTSDSDFLDMPMAVLVNSESYSAAELFAAALQEYDAAVVVGEQTSGKGYYQVTYRLNDGSAVGLSIGKYYTPHGISLEGVGITPDVVVAVDEETAAKILYGTLEPENDSQLQAALDTLRS